MKSFVVVNIGNYYKGHTDNKVMFLDVYNLLNDKSQLKIVSHFNRTIVNESDVYNEYMEGVKYYNTQLKRKSKTFKRGDYQLHNMWFSNECEYSTESGLKALIAESNRELDYLCKKHGVIDNHAIMTTLLKKY